MIKSLTGEVNLLQDSIEYKYVFECRSVDEIKYVVEIFKDFTFRRKINVEEVIDVFLEGDGVPILIDFEYGCADYDFIQKNIIRGNSIKLNEVNPNENN